MDFDDLDDAQEQAGNILEPEGPISDPPAVAGFKPNPAYGGCGPDGKLKILCFHGLNVNAGVMKLQLNTLFAGESKNLKEYCELICVDSPFETPMNECPLEHINLATKMGKGVPRHWFKKDGFSPSEHWSGIPEAIDVAIEMVKKEGPLDGLCGFSNGGEVVLQLCRLAYEGHQELQEQFKFALLMSSRWPKISHQDEFRPKAPIRIPMFHMCSKNDDQVGFPDYEDVDLRWDPKFRETVWHDRGHAPANLAENNWKRLSNFLRSFYDRKSSDFDGLDFRRLNPDTDDPTWDISVPVKTQEAAKLKLTAMSPMRLFWFTGEGEEDEDSFEPLKKELAKKGVSRGLYVEMPEISDVVVRKADDRFSPVLGKTHVCADSVDADTTNFVIKFVEKWKDLDAPVIFVAKGMSSYLALSCAKMLAGKGVMVWRFYAIVPPIYFPTNKTRGDLRSCGMVCVVPEHDQGASWWRFEIATRGEFKVKTIKKKGPRGTDRDPTWMDTTTDHRWAACVAEDLKGAFTEIDE
mmetsp:Transcript_49655/g.106415  ORF Transcript_49655/g.106415 Transcript_49655/m.106415 type:complete len:521 (+) Transcript_49655:79-1641(+)